MAIREEQVSETCVRHYSDQNLKIRQIETGIIYEDAVDVIPCAYTYEETEESIEDQELDPQEAINILLGDDV